MRYTNYLKTAKRFSLAKLQQAHNNAMSQLKTIRRLRKEKQAEGKEDNLGTLEAEVSLKENGLSRLIDLKTPKTLIVTREHPYSGDNQGEILKKAEAVFISDYIKEFKKLSNNPQVTTAHNYQDKYFITRFAGTENYISGELN